MIKLAMMSAIEGTEKYSLDHLVHVFASVRKSLFSGTALQKTLYFYINESHKFVFRNFFGLDFFVFKD